MQENFIGFIILGRIKKEEEEELYRILLTNCKYKLYDSKVTKVYKLALLKVLSI